MIKGFYAAASAMVVGMNRQNAISHNVANLDTPGFKQVLLTMEDWKKTQVVTQSQQPVSFPVYPSILFNQIGTEKLHYAGNLGLGVENSPEYTSYEQGALQNTGLELDLAIEGDGFFRIQAEDGVRYTRDGRFVRDSKGNLVTVDGHYVLDRNGRKITIGQGSTVEVSSNGTISVDGQNQAQIDVVTFADPEAQLTRVSLTSFTAEVAPTRNAIGSVRQGYLEASNVNIAQLMTQMIQVARSYEAAQQLVRVQDDLLGQSINTLGKV
jgi:flagellar basal-body rod protein FlgF